MELASPLSSLTMRGNETNYPTTPPDRFAHWKLHWKGKGLAVACAEGDLPVVVFLFGLAAGHGVDAHGPDADGNTPLHFAALSSEPALVAYLIAEGGDARSGVSLVEARDDDDDRIARKDSIRTNRRSSHHHTLMRKISSCRPSRVEVRNRDGETPLLRACSFGACSVVAEARGGGFAWSTLERPRIPRAVVFGSIVRARW